MADPELALETHAREELGIDPELARLAGRGRGVLVRGVRDRRAPAAAAVVLRLRRRAAIVVSVVLGSLGAHRRRVAPGRASPAAPPVRSAARQLAIAVARRRRDLPHRRASVSV